MPSLPSQAAGSARHQLPWFVAVGCTAAATHWAVVRALVETGNGSPLGANVAGWLMAFGVSFWGHHRFTFSAQGARLSSALPRFFGVSLVGFLINEATYAVLLHWGGWRYDLTLAAVLVLVAVGTFIVSRSWAFRHQTR